MKGKKTARTDAQKDVLRELAVLRARVDQKWTQDLVDALFAVMQASV
jgi:hypothetical protein